MNEQESFIGKWAIRIESWDGGSSEHGKAHLVQSEITDRLVMKCGRQLPLSRPRVSDAAGRRSGGEMREFVARRLETRCRQCRGLATG